MSQFKFKDKSYKVDMGGFLINSREWDENFAEGMAEDAKIARGLTKEHWDIIYYIRENFQKTGKCPLVYQTCRANGLHLKDLKTLFPAGYLRGACKLAGVTYKEGYLGETWMPESVEDYFTFSPDRTYEVDVRGFLVDPADWDEQFAIYKAFEMKMPEKLNKKHWDIIHFLRRYYEKNEEVPTVYDTCEAVGIEIEELEGLFPDGYHRGAVKIAGLKVR